MIPVTFEQYNVLMRGDSENTHEGLSMIELPAYSDGQKMVTCWQLNKEDLDELNRTGKIWLTIFLPVHPPVWLDADCPIK